MLSFAVNFILTLACGCWHSLADLAGDGWRGGCFWRAAETCRSVGSAGYHPPAWLRVPTPLTGPGRRRGKREDTHGGGKWLSQACSRHIHSSLGHLGFHPSLLLGGAGGGRGGAAGLEDARCGRGAVVATAVQKELLARAIC